MNLAKKVYDKNVKEAIDDDEYRFMKNVRKLKAAH